MYMYVCMYVCVCTLYMYVFTYNYTSLYNYVCTHVHMMYGILLGHLEWAHCRR